MNRKIRVLIVDDDAMTRKLIVAQLASAGFDVGAAASGEGALSALKEADYDVVFLDIQMSGLSGFDTLAEIKKTDDAPEIVMLTSDTSLASGIEAMRLGAYDYLTKPATLGEMEAVVRKADEKRRLLLQNASLRDAVNAGERSDDQARAPVYQSPSMQALIAQAEAIGRHDSTVLITGESGAGKDVLARFIHSHSARRNAPLISVNCGALPEALFESEFFGYERGAFTGATAGKRGLIEAADSSTLFLDEIGEMPLPAQVKLLNFLEQGCIRRVGSTRERAVDVRVIAATNRHLTEDVGQRRFRADLFYRLNVISMHVPPLRERREDIMALTDHFLELFRKRFQRPALVLAPAARHRIAEYDWPGNVRELRNCLERAVALSAGDVLDAEQVLPHQDSTPTSKLLAEELPLDRNELPTIDDLVRRYTLQVLASVDGNRERTAAILGISERKLYRKLREYKTASYSSGAREQA